MNMKISVGTRSVLFGAHCFFFHPWAVALAWWKLYRWVPAMQGGRLPAMLDPRAWICFFVHDLGYIGLANMDGEEGSRHPERAALFVSSLFDLRSSKRRDGPIHEQLGPWGRFVLFHSRHYAKDAGMQPSRLCAADKLALMYTPWWFYLPGVILSGEIDEYLREAHKRGAAVGIDSSTPRAWYETMRRYCARWAYEHKDGRDDGWTGDRKNHESDTPRIKYE